MTDEPTELQIADPTIVEVPAQTAPVDQPEPAESQRAEDDPSWEPEDGAPTATQEESAPSAPEEDSDPVVDEPTEDVPAPVVVDHSQATSFSDTAALSEAIRQNLPTPAGAPLNSFAVEMLTEVRRSFAAVTGWVDHAKAIGQDADVNQSIDAAKQWLAHAESKLAALDGFK